MAGSGESDRSPSGKGEGGKRAPCCFGNKKINNICLRRYLSFPRSFKMHFTNFIVDLICSYIPLINEMQTWFINIGAKIKINRNPVHSQILNKIIINLADLCV